MASKSRSHTERLARILDSLGEHIRTVPGEELLEAGREDGRDSTKVTARVKTILRSAFKTHHQKALIEAKQGYELELATISARQFHLPRTAQGRRNWFQAVLAQVPQLQPAFTLQNRNLSDLSDEDIESHLKKLAQLGVLDAIKLPEEE